MTNPELRYDTILLDFHGTFTNSNKGRAAHALNEAYQYALGRKITRAEFIEIMSRNDNKDPYEENISIPKYLDRMIDGHIPAEQKQTLIDYYNIRDDLTYVPKHLHVLRELARLGAVCVIVSNGKDNAVRPEVKRLGMDKYITEVYARGIGGLLTNVPKKPNPDTLDFVMKDLRSRGHDVRLARTLMVGDYEHDITAGSKMGLHTGFLISGPKQSPSAYTEKPTYALLDRASLKPNPEWLERGPVYRMIDLPKIITGQVS